MYKTQVKPQTCAANEELIDVLTAISVVSKSLARKLTILAGQRQSTEGGKSDEQNERYGNDHRKPAQMRYHY